MTDAHVALELEHVFLLKHIAYQPGILTHEKFTGLRGHDARRILAAVLQYCQRIIYPLIDRAYTDHSHDSAHEGPPVSPGSDFDSGQALELGPRFASLADHGSQPIAGGLAVRNQLRPVPPLFVIQVQQLGTDDHESDQHHAAHDAEHQTDHPVDRAKSQAAREVAKQQADDPTDQKHEHQNNQPPNPGRHAWIGE